MDVYSRPSRRRRRQLPQAPESRLLISNAGEQDPDQTNSISELRQESANNENASGRVDPDQTTAESGVREETDGCGDASEQNPDQTSARMELCQESAVNGNASGRLHPDQTTAESRVREETDGHGDATRGSAVPVVVEFWEEADVISVARNRRDQRVAEQPHSHDQVTVTVTSGEAPSVPELLAARPITMDSTSGGSGPDQIVARNYVAEYDMDISCIPFSDSDRFKDRYNVNLKDSSKWALKNLCFKESYNRNHTGFFKDLLVAGQENSSKEEMALCLLKAEFPDSSPSDKDPMSRLFEILSPSKKYNFPARCTLFAAAVYKMELKNVLDAMRSGEALLHYVAQLGYLAIIQLLHKWGADVNMKTRITNATPLLTVVSPNHLDAQLTLKTVEVLIQCGAKESVNAVNNAGDFPLLMAARRSQDEVFDELLKEVGDQWQNKQDNAGNTILHAAAQVNASEICRTIMEKAKDKEEMVAATNDDGQTAIHLAAMHSKECLEAIVENFNKDYSDYVQWFSALDSKGCTPLDIAAKAGQEATFEVMWEKMEKYSPPHIDLERRKMKSLIKEAEKHPSQWQKVTDALSVFPKRMLHRLLADDGADDNKPSFHQLITASSDGILEHGQQEAVRAVLDKSLFGDRVIVTETLEGAKHTSQFKLGGPCESRSTNHLKGSNLAALCASNFQVWDHPAVTLWLNHKLKSYGWIGLLLYSFLYWAFLGVVWGALEVSANLNVTSERLLDYNNDHGSQRISLGITAVILWSVLFVLDLSDIARFRLYYLKWFVVYPRIAVHFCFTALLVAHACGHNSQWVIASLFVICAAFRAMEVFSLWKWSSVYLVTLWIIVRRELLKFLLVALVLIIAFSAALRFAVQAERDEASRLQDSPTSQSGLCVPVKSLLENETNTTCVNTKPLTHMLASHLLGELENFHNLFYANFHSLARGSSGLGYDDGLEGYKLFTTTVYLAFLGLVVLLLVSVLVAQATDTYNSVHGIADQMANYSSARLLTQTSSILPMWLCCFFMKCLPPDVPYVWSHWPCNSRKKKVMHFFQHVSQIMSSVFVGASSSLIKHKENQGNTDDLKSALDAMQEENQRNTNDLKSALDAMQDVNERKFRDMECEMKKLAQKLQIQRKFVDMKGEVEKLASKLENQRNIDHDDLKSALDELNKAMQEIQRRLSEEQGNQ